MRGSPGAYIAGTAPKDYEAQACQTWRIRACLPHCGPLCGKGEARRKPGGWGYGWDSSGTFRAGARPCLETMIGRGLHASGEQILPCFTRRKERTIRIVSLCPLVRAVSPLRIPSAKKCAHRAKQSLFRHGMQQRLEVEWLWVQIHCVSGQ